jgi:hypothetical protein
VYERIKEARRADDMLDQGDWQREVKRSDWGAVIEVASSRAFHKDQGHPDRGLAREALIRSRALPG